MRWRPSRSVMTFGKWNPRACSMSSSGAAAFVCDVCPRPQPRQRQSRGAPSRGAWLSPWVCRGWLMQLYGRQQAMRGLQGMAKAKAAVNRNVSHSTSGSL